MSIGCLLRRQLRHERGLVRYSLCPQRHQVVGVYKYSLSARPTRV